MRKGATPVLIPNTMVKTFSADGTALETMWESRWLPVSIMGNTLIAHYDGGVAQLGEHLPCKQGVMSSNLTISTLVKIRAHVLVRRIRTDVLARVRTDTDYEKGIRRIPVMSKTRSVCECFSR